MKRTRRIVVLLAAMLIVAGCVPSLHPIYTDKDIIFEKALLGVWSTEESEATWIFTKSKEKDDAYRLLFTEEGGEKAGAFTTHLVNVGDEMFLDLYPVEPELESSDFYKLHLVRAHTFMHVVQLEPKLQFAVLDLDWLKEHLKANPKALKHEVVDDTIVLTASPKELQAFHLKHLKTEGAYSDPIDPMDRVNAGDEKAGGDE